jgi:hypothetical protein
MLAIHVPEGIPDGLPQWVESDVLLPLAAIIVLLVIWFTRRKE